MDVGAHTLLAIIWRIVDSIVNGAVKIFRASLLSPLRGMSGSHSLMQSTCRAISERGDYSRMVSIALRSPEMHDI